MSTGRAPTAAMVPSTFERRPLTLLFADLSGYTELTNTRDPEYVEGLVAPLLDHLGALAVEHGADVRPPQGDGFLAVFGAVTARDDDPRRAVRAAEAMRQWIEDQRAADPAVPGLHVGVASGEVLVRHGVSSLTGPAVNLAARLNDQAARGEVLVDATCVALCREAGWFGAGQRFVLQGFAEPVVAHRLLPPQHGSRLPLSRSRTPSAVHGRQAELDLLDRFWEEVVAQGTGQVVFVGGEAGIGKTTLVEGWLRARAGDLVLRAECRDYGHALPLGALTQAVLSLAGGDISQLALQLQGTRAALPARRLADLLARGESAVPHPREDDGTLVTALRALLTELGRGGPLVVFLDAFEHAGQDLRRVVASLFDRPLGAPVLCVLAGRGQARLSCQSFELAGLDEAASGLLCADVLAAPCEPVLVRHLHQRSGGNPLWLGELLELHQVHHGASDGPEQLGAGEEAVPTALRLAITARLDLLAPAERELLRQVCVPPDGVPVDEVAGATVLRLVAAGVLQTQKGRASFVHALVREVVYASMPRRDRALAHARLARDADDLAVRVYHLTRSWEFSVDPTAAAAPAHAALAALLQWVEQLQPVHLPSALETLERYAALRLGAGAADPLTASRLASVEAECLLDVERRDEAEACALEALRLARGTDDPSAEYRARVVLAHACFLGGRAEEARDRLAPLLTDPQLPPRWRGRALSVLASTRSYDPTGYALHFTQAYDCFMQAHDSTGAADAARALAWFHSVSLSSDFDVWNERARELTRADHLRGQALLARTTAMRAAASLDWELCRRGAEESLVYARSVGSRDLEVWALTLLGDAVLALGDEPALRSLDVDLQEIERVGRPRQRFNALAVRFRALVRLGDHAAAQGCRARLDEVLHLLGPAEKAHAGTVDGDVAFDRGKWAEAVAPCERAEWEALQLGWHLTAAGAALGALLARRRLGDADAPAGLLALAALYDSEDAPAAARLARAAAGQPQDGPALTLAEAAWAAECEAIHLGSARAWSLAAQAWGRLGLSASYALCLERAGDTGEAERVRRLLTG